MVSDFRVSGQGGVDNLLKVHIQLGGAHLGEEAIDLGEQRVRLIGELARHPERLARGRPGF